MIVERVYEFEVDPDQIALHYHDDYQRFIAISDNEDTSDFVFYLVDTYGFDVLRDDLDLSPSGVIDRIF